MAPSISNIPILISASAFLAIFLLFAGIYQYIRQNAKGRQLIEKVRESGEDRDRPDKVNSSSETKDATKKPFLIFLNSLGRRFVPEKSADYTQTRIRLLRAGLRRENAPALFWGSKFVLAGSLPGCFFFVITFLRPVDASTNWTVINTFVASSVIIAYPLPRLSPVDLPTV